jgi:hypothetical protein
MRYWVEWACLKVIQLVMCVFSALTLVLVGVPAPGDSVSVSAWMPLPPEMVSRAPYVLVPLLAFGWVAVWKASRSLKPQRFTDAEAEDIVQDAVADYRRCLEEPTREHDLVPDPRTARQVHSKTVPELAAERYCAERAEKRKWARIERDLCCDADFMAIARGVEDEFRNQT